MATFKLTAQMMSDVSVTVRLDRLDWLSNEEVRSLHEQLGSLMVSRGLIETPPLEYPEQKLVEYAAHIEAIRAYKTRTGASLRAAKDACDAYRANVPDYQERRGRFAHIPR